MGMKMRSRLPSSQLIVSEELNTGAGQKDEKDSVCFKSHTDNKGEWEAVRRGKKSIKEDFCLHGVVQSVTLLAAPHARLPGTGCQVYTNDSVQRNYLLFPRRVWGDVAVALTTPACQNTTAAPLPAWGRFHSFDAASPRCSLGSCWLCGWWWLDESLWECLEGAGVHP